MGTVLKRDVVFKRDVAQALSDATLKIAIDRTTVTAERKRAAALENDALGGHADEHMGIFYRKDRWRLEAQGDFWLSDTPGVPGSTPRISPE